MSVSNVKPSSRPVTFDGDFVSGKGSKPVLTPKAKPQVLSAGSLRNVLNANRGSFDTASIANPSKPQANIVDDIISELMDEVVRDIGNAILIGPLDEITKPIELPF